MSEPNDGHHPKGANRHALAEQAAGISADVFTEWLEEVVAGGVAVEPDPYLLADRALRRMRKSGMREVPTRETVADGFRDALHQHGWRGEQR